MKILFGFVLGVVLTIAAMTYAQSGAVMDQHGNLYQFHQFPGGATQYWGPNGQTGTLYQTPPSTFGRNPC